MPQISDVMALRSVGQAAELIGLENGGLLLFIAEMLAILYGLFLAARNGWKAAAWAGRKLHRLTFPPAPPPPEPDPLVREILTALEDPDAEWKPADLGGRGVFVTYAVSVKLGPKGVESLTSNGQDAWLDLSDKERSDISAAVERAVGRVEDGRKRSRREAARRSIGGGHGGTVPLPYGNHPKAG